MIVVSNLVGYDMVKKLLAWEEHTRQNTIDGQLWGGMITYWRRCDESGREIIVLSAEGIAESQCWCWTFSRDLHGKYCGDSRKTFEGAKMGADAMALQFGYKIEDTVGFFSKLQRVWTLWCEINRSDNYQNK